MQGLQLGFEFPLGSAGGSSLGGQFVELFVGVGQLGLGLSAGTVGLFEQGPRLLEFSVQGVGAAFGNVHLLAHVLAGAGLLLQGGLGVLELSLVALDALLGFSVGLVGVVEGDLELVDVRFELLLHAQSLGFTLGLGFEAGLHRVDGALVVLAGVLELFLLLLDAAVDFLAHLRQFQLGAEHLVLLLLQGAFSLLEGGLQLLLLDFQAAALFVDFVHVAASFSDLIHQVLDFIYQQKEKGH